MLPVSWLLSFALCGAAAESYPYHATVAQPDAVVRSGPGSSYYVTQYLPEDTEIEVHSQHPSGWLAIRPPARSFSWIPAIQLNETNERGVAVVVAPNTVSWIGTLLGTPEQYQWQVRLQPGELVQVISETERLTSRGRQAWYKIAPPSGEFRWIHQSQVSVAGEAKSTGSEPASQPVGEGDVNPPNGTHPAKATQDSIQKRNASQTAALESSEDSGTDTVAEGVASAVHDPEVRPAGHWTAARSRPRPYAESSPVTRPEQRSPDVDTVRESHAAERATSDRRETSSARTASGRDGSRSASRVESFTPSTANIRELDFELSLLATQNPDTWDLRPLRNKATQLIDDGRSSLERGQARLLLEKIGEFEMLQKRYSQVLDDERQSLESASAGPAADTGHGESNVDYDGTGWLMPVHSTRRLAPPYALLDSTGNVLAFVTPAPGMNLNRYLKKEVGILGDRRYLESLKSNHLTAERVIQLDRHRH